MTTEAAYGSWTSPITAADLALGEHPVHGGTWVGDDVWWLETRPGEGGRYAVRRAGADGLPVDVLPAPWNARTRVHEYGGGSWAVTPDGGLVFTEFTDQRLYLLRAGESEPEPLTPLGGGEGGGSTSFRFGEIALRGHEVVAVRETHGEGDTQEARIARDIVAVPLDSSAASDPSRLRSVVSGSHFLAFPRFSPNGSHLAWIAWEHPQMPWDGTELRVGRVAGDGSVEEWSTLAGSTTESILEPTWVDDSTLIVSADRSGWWNLEEVTLAGDRTPLLAEAAEYGGPLWSLGLSWFDRLPDGRLLAVRTLGSDSLVVIDPADAAGHDGSRETIELPLSSIALGPRNGRRVLLVGGSSTLAAGLRILDLDSHDLTDVRLAVDSLPDVGYLPVAEERTFAGKRDVHAFVFPPRNVDFAAPEGELPPYVAFVHGGPTGRTTAVASLVTKAFFTSRGIGVIDINYGGSTGYGRAYRETLRGQWGVVDVEDTVAAIRGLADAGLADGARLAIRGGSAGGWTVLAALTSSDVFAAGTSYYGVAELTQFARDTHDFESRYLDGLIGPLPEAAELYRSRAPLTQVGNLATPVLLLQGLDDPIVPPSQAEMFRDALEARGIPHAYIAYAGESHGFRRAETIISATEAELSFYGQIMGFEPTGIPLLHLENVEVETDVEAAAETAAQAAAEGRTK